MDPAPHGASVVVEGVSRSYGPLVPALRGVSFSIAAGEGVLLVGASGSGKSTVLNLVAGLDRPDGGRVLVDGQPVAELSDPARFRRETIGFVFQLHHLLPGLTALENVEVALLPAGVPRRERLRRSAAALADVELQGRADHLPSELSGGERQRVAIARAIVGRPRLLLADEPTGALDSAGGRRVLELLDRLRHERGMTLLLVSYDPGARRYTDRVLYLRDGQVGAEPDVAAPPTPALRPDAAA